MINLKNNKCSNFIRFSLNNNLNKLLFGGYTMENLQVTHPMLNDFIVETQETEIEKKDMDLNQFI